MATKQNGVPCYEKAALDEPLFVLRSTDVLAPGIVREWAERARKAGTRSPKVSEALACADAMEQYAKEHGGPKIPD
jgi:hypothetical protein